MAREVEPGYGDGERESKCHRWAWGRQAGGGSIKFRISAGRGLSFAPSGEWGGASFASLRVKINISRRPPKKAKNAFCTKRSLFFRPVPVASQLEGGTVEN